MRLARARPPHTCYDCVRYSPSFAKNTTGGFSFNSTVFIRDDGVAVVCVKEANYGSGGDCPFQGDFTDPDNVCRVCRLTERDTANLR